MWGTILAGAHSSDPGSHQTRWYQRRSQSLQAKPLPNPTFGFGAGFYAASDNWSSEHHGILHQDPQSLFSFFMDPKFNHLHILLCLYLELPNRPL